MNVITYLVLTMACCQHSVTFPMVLSQINEHRHFGNGVAINVYINEWSPYTYRSVENRSIWRGSEIELIETFATKLDASLAYIDDSQNATIDLYIGGYSLLHPPSRPIDRPQLIFSHSYEDDSLTWCVSRSKLVPVWRNIVAVVDDPIVYYVGGVAILASAVLGYIQGIFEEWTYDFCTMITKVMQILVGTAIKLRINTNGTRFILVFELWGSYLALIVVVTFYTTIIQRSIHEYQIHTVRELINGNFRLAGNGYALTHLLNQQSVGVVISMLSLVRF